MRCCASVLSWTAQAAALHKRSSERLPFTYFEQCSSDLQICCPFLLQVYTAQVHTGAVHLQTASPWEDVRSLSGPLLRVAR